MDQIHIFFFFSKVVWAVNTWNGNPTHGVSWTDNVKYVKMKVRFSTWKHFSCHKLSGKMHEYIEVKCEGHGKAQVVSSVSTDLKGFNVTGLKICFSWNRVIEVEKLRYIATKGLNIAFLCFIWPRKEVLKKGKRIGGKIIEILFCIWDNVSKQS